MLREMTDQDESDLFAYSDREVSKYLDWYVSESEEHARKLIAHWREQYQADTYMRFGISLKADNKIIGTIPIKCSVAESIGEAWFPTRRIVETAFIS